MYEYYDQYVKNAGKPDAQQRWANQLFWEIARHAVGEEIVIYPLMEKHLGSKGLELANQLVERETVSQPTEAQEQAHDDYEDQKELADEHQRLRRKFIQQQGGFLKENEGPIQQLDEEEGGPVRQSRFKAARLSRQ